MSRERGRTAAAGRASSARGKGEAASKGCSCARRSVGMRNRAGAAPTAHPEHAAERPARRTGAGEARWEREADRAADAVVAAAEARPVEVPITPRGSSTTQRCADCGGEDWDEEEGSAQRKQAASPGGPVSAAEADVLARGSHGRALDAAERAYYEPRFGRDFGVVRVHTDGAAAEAAGAMHARAFTRGRDVYFAAGEYVTGSAAGRWLLAHELTHVVQQTDPRGAAAVQQGAEGEREKPLDEAGEVLRTLGPGDPLETGVRSRMESAFGTGFGEVRVHRDGTADAVAGRLGARAVTVGSHIAFGRGSYQPQTAAGQLMIAHELAHVLQQRGAEPSGAEAADGVTRGALEQDADRSAGNVLGSLWTRAAGSVAAVAGQAMPQMRSGVRVQRCADKTPDGVDVGPTDTSRTFCLKSGSFVSTTSVHSNTETAVSGLQEIRFEGEDTGDRHTHECSCSCGLYRQWVRGWWRMGSPNSLKQHRLHTCGHYLPLSETEFREERVGCVGGNASDPCVWRYADAPGWTSGLKEGTHVDLHYEFLHQVWDRCQGREVATHTRTLDVSGDHAPRTITWT